MKANDDLSRVTEELRAEFYRRRLRFYEIAPAIGMHPIKVSAVLNGKRPMTPALAERIRAAIEGAQGSPRRPSTPGGRAPVTFR